jgi:AraC family transcriptional regulator
VTTKASTAQDYRERLNRVFLYIEQHLVGSLALAELASIACFSPFHFHRIFTAFSGESVADYVRRLRLERAAQHLAYTTSAITEIALSSGYETPAAFSRAFAAHFGVTPTEYRQRTQPARGAGTRLFDLHEPAAKEPTMKPDLRTIDPISVIYVRRTGPYRQVASEAFTALMQFAGPRGLIGPTAKMIGASHDDPQVTGPDKLRYDACLSVDREVAVAGEVGRKTLAGGRYAVFLHRGSYDLFQHSYDQIFKDWLPQSGEHLRDEPCFEQYLNTPMDTKTDDLRTEIWLPLK